MGGRGSEKRCGKCLRVWGKVRRGGGMWRRCRKVFFWCGGKGKQVRVSVWGEGEEKWGEWERVWGEVKRGVDECVGLWGR